MLMSVTSLKGMSRLIPLYRYPSMLDVKESHDAVGEVEWHQDMLMRIEVLRSRLGRVGEGIYQPPLALQVGVGHPVDEEVRVSQ